MDKLISIATADVVSQHQSIWFVDLLYCSSQSLERVGDWHHGGADSKTLIGEK